VDSLRLSCALSATRFSLDEPRPCTRGIHQSRYHR
jgi:hypothetical protein